MTTLVTCFLIASMLFNLWFIVLLMQDRRAASRQAIAEATKAVRDYMAECAGFDAAIPERCAAWPDERSEVGMRSHRDDVWADPRCSHRGADCNCPAGTCQFVTAPRQQQNKPTIQEQINAVLTDRINALESYRRNHAQRLNDVEEALAETGDEVAGLNDMGFNVTPSEAVHLRRMAGDMDFGDDAQTDWANHQKNYREAARATIAEMFEVRDVTDYEAELMMAARQREAEEKLVPGTLVVTRNHILADKIFMAADLDYTQPMTTVVTESPNKDFDPEKTQPIYCPYAMVDFYLPVQWSDGDQTVVDAQQVVRDGWSNA